MAVTQLKWFFQIVFKGIGEHIQGNFVWKGKYPDFLNITHYASFQSPWILNYPKGHSSPFLSVGFKRSAEKWMLAWNRL